MSVAMNAGDVMTSNVATVTATTTLEVAIRLMLDKHISGLPVVDTAGTVVGILTEGDLLRRAELGTDAHRSRWLEFILGPSRLADDYVASHSRVVNDVMTTAVQTVDVKAPLSAVVALMESKRIKRVPVLARGALVGMVSRSDLLRALAQALVAAPAVSGSDAATRDAVLAELGRQPWAAGGGISVVVVAGVVTLEGTIFEEAERAALRVAAENVAGVTSVCDHLVWVEPNSGFTYTPP